MNITTDFAKYLIEGVVSMIIACVLYLVLNLQVTPFFFAVMAIIGLTAGFLMLIEEIRDNFIADTTRKRFLLNLIFGIVLVLLFIFVLVPVTNGMNMVIAVPVLIVVFSLLFTGVASIFIGIYCLIKNDIIKKLHKQ